jgi:hypothetical protein
VISSSIFKRAISARSRDTFICSGVICLAAAGLCFPAMAAFAQLRKVCSISPGSSATRTILPAP